MWLRKIGNKNSGLCIVNRGLNHKVKILFIILLCTIHCIFAEEPKVTFSIDRDSVVLGDQLVFTINMQGIENPKAPELPVIPAFESRFRGARQSSHASFTLIVQGQTVRQQRSGRSYQFDYILIPKKSGILEIPTMDFKIQDVNYSTKSFQIEVLSEAEKSDDIFIQIIVNKNELYLGERLVVTFKWYLKENIDSYRLNIPWLEGLKSFLIEDTKQDRTKKYQRIIVNGDNQLIAEKLTDFYKGQRYAVIQFQKILTPIATGNYTLEPTFLKCSVIKGYQRSQRSFASFDMFESDLDGFFGSSRQAITESFSTRTDSVNITVKSIPKKGQTEYFTGAVGNFDFTVEPNPKKVKVGEPITVTMKVSGTGNIGQIKLPDFPEIENFRSYEPESQVQIESISGEIVGEKIFEKVLIPKNEGEYTIPAIRFDYLDPTKSQYQAITRGPFQITVEKSEDDDEDRLLVVLTEEGQALSQKNKIKLLKRDIRYIKTSFSQDQQALKNLYQNKIFTPCYFLIPMALLIILLVIERKRFRLRTDSGFARQENALKKFEKKIFILNEFAQLNDHNAFYDGLARALSCYVMDKFNLPAGQTHIEVLDNIKRVIHEKEIIHELNDLFDRSDFIRFSAHKLTENDLKDELKRLIKLIKKLEKRIS